MNVFSLQELNSMTMTLTRVVLAEDNELMRKGIRHLLKNADDISVIGEAKNGLEAVSLVEKLKPDLLLLDVEMPQMSGIEVAHHLNRLHSSTRVLVLSSYDDQEYIQSMLASGAAGYLIKDEAPQRILEAVRGVAMGETGWVSPQVKERLRKKS